MNRANIKLLLLAIAVALLAGLVSSGPSSAAQSGATGPLSAPLISPLTGDIFTRNTPVSFPAPAGSETDSYSNPFLTTIGCSSNGNCSAVGTVYQGTQANPVVAGMAVDEINGVWQTPVSFPIPPQTISGQSYAYLPTSWEAMACTSTGTCLAVGVQNSNTPVEVTETAGVWNTASVMTLPGDTAPTDVGPTINFRGLSCASASYCVGVGSYTSSETTNSSYNPINSMSASGSISGLGALTLVQTYSQLYTVSCPSGTTTCTAGGQETEGSGSAIDNYPMVIAETGGSWGSPTDISNSPGAYGASVDSIACPQLNTCSAAGVFNAGSGGTSSPFTIQQAADGSWSAPATLGFSVGAEYTIYPSSMSCISPGNCVLGGLFGNASKSGDTAAFYADESGGTWGSAALMPLPSDANGAYSEVGGVSCGGTQCGEVGLYDSSTASNDVSYAVTASANLEASSTGVSCPPQSGSTTVYQCTATVSDASGSGTPQSPTGTVSFTTGSGNFNNSSCSLVAAGAGTSTCSVNYTPGATPPYMVSANYNGDSTFNSSSGMTTVTPLSTLHYDSRRPCWRAYLRFYNSAGGSYALTKLNPNCYCGL